MTNKPSSTRRDWEKQPLTTSEHIAADIRAERFPKKSDPATAMAEIDEARPVGDDELVAVTHASDCSLHNAPALPVGPCDCGGIDEQSETEALRSECETLRTERNYWREQFIGKTVGNAISREVGVRQLSALPRQLRDLDPINEPETTKQIGREAADSITDLQTRLERYREALRPFAEFADKIKDAVPDAVNVFCQEPLVKPGTFNSVGHVLHFRLARKALGDSDDGE
jgi:hypothetical protein